MPPTAVSSSVAGAAVTPDFGPQSALTASLAELVKGMTGSEILRISGEVRKLIAAGRPICNLTVGDFDPRQFPIPPELLQALHEALDAGETNYPPSDGVLALREAVAAWAVETQGVRYPLESILIASGVRPLLYAAFKTVVNPGDKVLYGVPSWNVNHYVWLTGATGVVLNPNRERGFHPTAEEVAPLLSDVTLLCLCSPANPTGTMMDPAELARITEAVVAENERRARAGARALFLLWDEVYGSLVYGGEHANPVHLVPASAPWVIALDGASKAFAATGLRVGWSFAAPAVTARMRDFLGHVGAWAPRPEQIATAKFIRNPQAIASFREKMDAGIRTRLEALYEGFQALRAEGYPVDCVNPQGAIYLSLQLDLIGKTVKSMKVTTNDEIRGLLLEQAGLAVVPFQAFGLKDDTGWFRLSVGAVSMQDIADAWPRIRKLLDSID